MTRPEISHIKHDMNERISCKLFNLDKDGIPIYGLLHLAKVFLAIFTARKGFRYGDTL